MELNREQIIKALECCCGGWCIRDGCPLYKAEEEDDIGKCISELAKNALTLIKELTKDVERVSKQCANIIVECDERDAERLEQVGEYAAKVRKLTKENEKLEAMLSMWKSTAYCEKDRLNSIKADTVERMKRDLYVEFIYIAGCQKDNEPNMRSQEVCEVLDKVAKKHLVNPENHNLCVSCGEVIPEGRQVCPNCEK